MSWTCAVRRNATETGRMKFMKKKKFEFHLIIIKRNGEREKKIKRKSIGIFFILSLYFQLLKHIKCDQKFITNPWTGNEVKQIRT